MIQQSWGHIIVGTTTIESFQGLLFSETAQNMKRPLYMKEVYYDQNSVYTQYVKQNVTQKLVFFFPLQCNILKDIFCS